MNVMSYVCRIKLLNEESLVISESLEDYWIFPLNFISHMMLVSLEHNIYIIMFLNIKSILYYYF